MILILSDIHGDYKTLQRAIDNANEVGAAALIQIGDFGLFRGFGMNNEEQFKNVVHSSKCPVYFIDGNHDGAFTIDQQYSGIIKTNIVLDREIRDSYELKVTATDEGSPPKTGYTKVIVKIIDINDNQPQFPPSTPITISEGKIFILVSQG